MKNKNLTILTERENEIMELVSKGYSNFEIAKKLYISVATVKTHIYNIYSKLNLYRSNMSETSVIRLRAVLYWNKNINNKCAWKSLEGTFCPEAEEKTETYEKALKEIRDRCQDIQENAVNHSEITMFIIDGIAKIIDEVLNG